MVDRLCGSIPITTRPIALSSHDSDKACRRGGQRYFERDRPFSSHNLVTVTDGRTPCESHAANSRAADMGRTSPGTSTLARPGLSRTSTLK